MEAVLVTALAIFFGAVAYWTIIPQHHRSLFLFVCSLLWIVSLNIVYAVLFTLNTAIVYLAAGHMGKMPASRLRWLQFSLIWLIGNLYFFKYATDVCRWVIDTRWWSAFGLGGGVPTFFFPLGISYITFRLIHYAVEAYRNRIPRSSFTEFAAYVLFFPTFLAGPVERFPQFQAQARNLNRCDLSEVNYGLFRILKGLIKKTIVADPLGVITLAILRKPETYPWVSVFGAVYGSAIRLYMDFSGYSDIAIGVARLFGYRIVENFDAPFFKRNIALFWRSWHISVYTWIRDYFFFPLFVPHASRLKLYMGIFCSMMVFQLWHRASVEFFMMGLYFSIGLMGWQVMCELSRKAPQWSKVIERTTLVPLGIFATFTFFSLGSLFVQLDVHAGVAVFIRLTHR